MGDMTGIVMLFILMSGIILVLLLFKAQSGSGQLTVGKAKLQIDFENSPKWENVHKQPAGKLKTPPTRYYLRVRGTSWRYPLGTDPVYIGRADDCQIKLRDKSADTRQAVIYWEDGRLKINNLSLRVPTQVNGQTFSKQNIGNGNMIRTGRTEFILQDSQHRR